ncbi:hypothetical protein DIPPA_03909 [Diplonema papillatum]|nr:hypothetical protein DIPPA_03909 [Diplonema papillatum]|eukprot:gene22164-34013_t
MADADVPAGRPVRVVSLVPAVTDALCRLRLHRSVLGRTRACRWPPVALQISEVAVPGFYPDEAPSVTRGMPDVSTLDLLLAPICEEWRCSEHSAVYLVPTTGSLKLAIGLVKTVAAAAGAAERGSAVMRALLSRLHAATRPVRKKAAAAAAGGNVPAAPKRVLVVQALSETAVFGSGHWMPEAVSRAGGTCVGAAGPGVDSAPQRLTAEEVRGLAPDIIVVGGSGRQSAAAELRESGRLGFFSGVARVYLPVEGGDAAIGLSAAGKEGGALAVAAVEALVEVIHEELFGVFGQVVRLAPETDLDLLSAGPRQPHPEGRSSAHPSGQPHLVHPPQEYIPPSRPATHTSRTSTVDHAYHAYPVHGPRTPPLAHSPPPRRGLSPGGAYAASPLPTEPVFNGDAAPFDPFAGLPRFAGQPALGGGGGSAQRLPGLRGGRRPPSRCSSDSSEPVNNVYMRSPKRKRCAESAAGHGGWGYRDGWGRESYGRDVRSPAGCLPSSPGSELEGRVDDPKAIIYEHVDSIRTGDFRAARLLFAARSRHRATEALLARLRPLVQKHLHVGGASVCGRYAQDECAVRVPVSVKGGGSLLWEIVFLRGSWWVDNVTTQL